MKRTLWADHYLKATADMYFNAKGSISQVIKECWADGGRSLRELFFFFFLEQLSHDKPSRSEAPV